MLIDQTFKEVSRYLGEVYRDYVADMDKQGTVSSSKDLSNPNEIYATAKSDRRSRKKSNASNSRERKDKSRSRSRSKSKNRESIRSREGVKSRKSSVHSSQSQLSLR